MPDPTIVSAKNMIEAHANRTRWQRFWDGWRRFWTLPEMTEEDENDMRW